MKNKTNQKPYRAKGVILGTALCEEKDKAGWNASLKCIRNKSDICLLKQFHPANESLCILFINKNR